ncbi:hypothetical protein, partial [Agrobacterium pusense]|uniref:hypothetical protein n=1 Tax=Agrobacterium pusense TaxID=648995 RepID=UPI001AECBD77
MPRQRWLVFLLAVWARRGWKVLKLDHQLLEEFRQLGGAELVIGSWWLACRCERDDSGKLPH